MILTEHWCRNGSSPWPMRAPLKASLALPKPISRHTTLASWRPQRSSHTLPHLLCLSTSTRPSPIRAPAFSLTVFCNGVTRDGYEDQEKKKYLTPFYSLCQFYLPLICPSLYRYFKFLLLTRGLGKPWARDTADHSWHAPCTASAAVPSVELHTATGEVYFGASAGH